MQSLIRSRWAAIGAAVAVTLGVGGIGLVSATSPGGASALVSIEPCRLVDTRPAPDTVGDKSSPLGPQEILTIAAHGTNGQCTGIPITTTGLALNVTAIGATETTFLTIWGTGDRPNASHLNPAPGQPPTPNAVNTGLTGAGELKIFNRFGNVNVIVDVLGYYTDHHHDDRYYQKAEVDTAIATSQSKTLFATVAPASADAEVVRGVGAVSVTWITTGYYRVTFDRDITGCTWTATYGQPDDSNVLAAWATVRGRPAATDVGVVLRNSVGGLVDGAGFHIAVFCP